MSRLSGKYAVVTGGASGIGAATATRFVAEGARVVIADVQDDAGEALALDLGGDACRYVRCDVTSPEEIGALLDEAATFFAASGGTLNVLFNNAGIGLLGEVPDVTPEAWARVMDVDLNAVFHACRLAIPTMRANGGGSIVNTASVSGLGGDYGMAAYNTAKGALVNLTRTMALDHGKDGIRVNALCPGYIETGLTARFQQMPELQRAFETSVALGRAGSAEEMANVVTFLASDEASYVTGAAIVADGGRMAHTGQPNMFAAVQQAGPS